MSSKGVVPEKKIRQNAKVLLELHLSLIGEHDEKSQERARLMYAESMKKSKRARSKRRNQDRTEARLLAFNEKKKLDVEAGGGIVTLPVTFYRHGLLLARNVPFAIPPS